MKFYLISDRCGEVIGCTMTLPGAHVEAREQGHERYSIARVETPVTADTIRRLLGGHGGYATAHKQVFPRV